MGNHKASQNAAFVATHNLLFLRTICEQNDISWNIVHTFRRLWYLHFVRKILDFVRKICDSYIIK